MFHVEHIHLLHARLNLEKRMRTHAESISVEELIDMYQYGQLVMPDEPLRHSRIVDKQKFIEDRVDSISIPYGWVVFLKKKDKWLVNKGADKIFLILSFLEVLKDKDKKFQNEVDKVNFKMPMSDRLRIKNGIFQIEKMEEEWATTFGY